MGKDREGGAQRAGDPKGENERNAKVCQVRGTSTCGRDDELGVNERAYAGRLANIKAMGGWITPAEGGCTGSEEQTEDRKDRKDTEETHAAGWGVLHTQVRKED